MEPINENKSGDLNRQSLPKISMKECKPLGGSVRHVLTNWAEGKDLRSVYKIVATISSRKILCALGDLNSYHRNILRNAALACETTVDNLLKEEQGTFIRGGRIRLVEGRVEVYDYSVDFGRFAEVDKLVIENFLNTAFREMRSKIYLPDQREQPSA